MTWDCGAPDSRVVLAEFGLAKCGMAGLGVVTVGIF